MQITQLPLVWLPQFTATGTQQNFVPYMIVELKFGLRDCVNEPIHRFYYKLLLQITDHRKITEEEKRICSIMLQKKILVMRSACDKKE